MRVPIFPQDLENGGFTRLAKRLKRDWLGTRPLRLSEAQEILSHCLGYSSYHDVAQSAEIHNDDVDFPPLQSLTVEFLQTICAELYENGHCKVFDLGELQETIYNWPFLLLRVYRNHYGHSNNYIVNQSVKAANIETFLTSQTPRPEHHPKDYKIGFSSEQLQPMTEHHDHLSSSAYIPRHPRMGVCPNNGPDETVQGLRAAQYPCIDSVSLGKTN
ncbi:hypothetical protein JFT81_08300 [Pseudomonas sp. TH43]|uniref:hypothetical protein n=1 Tax=Pseudomonas sp. TH43 TaxID=2796407 RepID=UPI0019135604|nr:hypothetical protein [Pseudomonas sp. TH43]MBK5374633.1 hypothetical protein [Pseudomonas sp. TH43]